MFLIMLLLAIHLLAAVFWVGGMAFAYTVLRPAAGGLDPPVRLPLWRRVFARFLPWVGVSIVALLVSGFGMIFLIFGKPSDAAPYVLIMATTGIIMMLLFLHLIFAPWRRFRFFCFYIPTASRNKSDGFVFPTSENLHRSSHPSRINRRSGARRGASSLSRPEELVSYDPLRESFGLVRRRMARASRRDII